MISLSRQREPARCAYRRFARCAYRRLASFHQDQRGITQIEYGLIAVLTSIVAILLLGAIAFDVLEFFDVIEERTGVDPGGELPAPPQDDDVEPS